MTNGEKIIEKLIELFGRKPSIAFLPYKFAMWDSMETVYDAAIKNRLETYLMPIPYVTRGDGLWHDETDLYGMANTIHCNALFDLKPDIVVIHNPYDGNNKVTSIDPRFYSDKLKEAGFKVVYLSYCGSIFSARLILHQGIKNADYIFVDSEEEKQRFIELWKQRNVDKSENIFVCGLPKYEASQKKSVYPECFTKTEKRIVLICGTLVSFLNAPEQRIEKWKAAVKKYSTQENVTVIFRPHPLMDDTINAMAKQYKLKYDAFLEEIEQYCIIDKSQLFQNAVKLSDYLVSDPSSVVEVWKRTGKPFEIID